MSGYAFHPEAFTDLNEIWDYIAERNIQAADDLIEDIFNTLRTLAASPHIGFRRPELTTRSLRFAIVREYLIAYAPDEDPLVVIALIHGRRSPRVMATILQERKS